VVKGSYGAVALHNSVVLSDPELNLLVQGGWSSETQSYDWHKIDEALRQVRSVLANRCRSPCLSTNN
jgi:hypothetical protein